MRFLFDILGDVCCHFKAFGKKKKSSPNACLASANSKAVCCEGRMEEAASRVKANQTLVCHGVGERGRCLLLACSGLIPEATKTKDRLTTKHANFSHIIFYDTSAPARG